MLKKEVGEEREKRKEMDSTLREKAQDQRQLLEGQVNRLQLELENKEDTIKRLENLLHSEKENRKG